MADDSDLRIGTAEREQAVELLTRHLGEGRLTVTEFDERCARVVRAGTGSDLAALFVDLPAVPTPRRRRHAWFAVPVAALAAGLWFGLDALGLGTWFVPISLVVALAGILLTVAAWRRARPPTPAFLRPTEPGSVPAPARTGSNLTMVPIALAVLAPALLIRQPVLLLAAAGFAVYAVVRAIDDGGRR